MYDPTMVPLACRIPETIRRALDERRRTSGETIDAIVEAALVEHLQAGWSTLFQVSTAGALVEGVHEGAVSVHFLKQHGDLGLGTFTNLDGEMVVVDGRCYQVRSDGSVREVDDAERSPYAVLTRFNPEPPVELGAFAGVAELHNRLNALRTTDNLFYAYQIDGLFEFVRTRAVPKVEEGTRLLAAAARQPEFDFHNVRGTLVGFWSPGYVKILTVPGYHFHFLTEDRKAGGHLLDCRARSLTARVEREANLRVALPETPSFLKADLSHDGSAELDQAEKQKGDRKNEPARP
ncbi:acetolactate decarboxylase [Paludisphaera borealis]|uniref:Alpha-acetolactate decarboxylase n=1 Tax=Paludisphaera borealis TaxID=1387353 RepID=A0A1U7CS37_9BACT|nr:acetolactate decarboxylase [Paludisphaera borealis]APW61757.1 Alpha-acetolactate decarboxylase [Paludisphaera borealis]